MTAIPELTVERSVTDHRGAPQPLTRAQKLGFVGFASEDVDRLIDHYVEHLGFAVSARTGDAAYLTTGTEHHCVVITTGETRGRTSVGFEIADELADAARRLEAGGVEAALASDPAPGIGEWLTIAEPGGTPLHLYEAQAPSGETSVPGIRPTKLGHVSSHVPDLREVQTFYEDVVGCRWSDTIRDHLVFMRCNADHHALNFMSFPSDRGTFEGLNHIAFELRDLVHLRDALDHLAKHGCPLQWGPGRHGPGHNIAAYHRDPDGHRIELFTELDLMLDERAGVFEPRPWHADSPQKPKVWEWGLLTANLWGTEMTF